MEANDTLKIIRGLILMNVFGFRLHEADFWNKVHEQVSGEEINIDAFKIMRLSTAEKLFDDEITAAQDAINRLAIDRPDIYEVMSVDVKKLQKLIE